MREYNAAKGADRVGLGPQFIEVSCDGCHDDGARRRFLALDAASRRQLLDWLGTL